MIRAILRFVAEGVSTDRETDQVSAFRLLETVTSESYPVPIARAAFLCLWERDSTDPSRCRAELTITVEDQEITPQTIDLDFGRFLRNRCVINIDGLVIGQPGKAVFRLAIPGHGAAEWTLAAKTTAEAAMTGATGSTLRAPLYDSGQVSMSENSVAPPKR